MYKQGGISRVCSLNRDGTFDVKFHIGGRRTEKRVLPYFIHKYDMYGGVEAVQEHFIFCENEEEKLNNSFSDSETNIEESPEYNPSFVRRSMRRPGTLHSSISSLTSHRLGANETTEHKTPFRFTQRRRGNGN